MPGVAQRRTKLAGTWYDRGAAVPDELVTSRTVGLGLVAAASGPDGSDDSDLAAELEATKAKLAAAEARLTEAGISLDEGNGDGQPFDPAEHKVDDVLAHADANPDDLGRVLDAELGGKARKTLLDELSRRQDEAAGDGDGDGDDPAATDDPGGDAGGE